MLHRGGLDGTNGTMPGLLRKMNAGIGTGREKKKKKRQPHLRAMDRVNRNMIVIGTTTMKSMSELVRGESCLTQRPNNCDVLARRVSR